MMKRNSMEYSRGLGSYPRRDKVVKDSDVVGENQFSHKIAEE
jgi:hypothetical protein